MIKEPPSPGSFTLKPSVNALGWVSCLYRWPQLRASPVGPRRRPAAPPHAAGRSRPLWAAGLKPGLGMAGGRGRREAAAGGSEIASVALPGPLPPHLCCVRWQRWEQGERRPQGRSRPCWIWPGAGAARWEEDVAKPLTGSPLPFLPTLCFQKRAFAFY